MVATSCVSYAQTPAFQNWPVGRSPQEEGKRLAERFAKSPHLAVPTIGYPEVCAWYGALEFARITHDGPLMAELIKRFEPLFGPEKNMLPPRRHVDDEVFGAVPLEIYLQNKDQRALDLGLRFADRQWQSPQPDGLTSETRYWIDDMFMITILQVQAYRATGDRKYIDRAAAEMMSYLDRLQQPSGLFFHGTDAPNYWGRGNGWVAMGMTEMLRSLPMDHPARPRILAAYRLMMAALLKYQGKDGMWRQLIDHEDAWPESSATGMFAAALISGVREGWLDSATCAPAARKAWIALTGYIDQNSDVVNTCVGTDKSKDPEYYYDRPRDTGDLHGQAAALWAVDALLR
jgi:rhamnogalacturonyl hydrolase YesR